MLETTNKFFENCSVGVKVSTILFHGIDSGALPLPSTTQLSTPLVRVRVLPGLVFQLVPGYWIK